MTQDNGGPAFPCPSSADELKTYGSYVTQQHGMALRDWFAGMALSYLVINSYGKKYSK